MISGARSRRILFAVALVAAVVGSGSVARADVSSQACSAHAVVVVEPGPGAVTICFDGTISGLDALQLAGANPTTYGFAGQGAAVCQLFGVGNPADSSCLVGPGGQYWAYYRAAPGAGGWTYSRGGASTTTVVDGSVEGWRYGTGGAPGFVSYCAIVGCGPPPPDPPPPPTAAAPPVTAAPSGTTPPAAANGGGTAPATTGAKGTGKSAKGGDSDSGGKGDAGAVDGKDGVTSTTGKSDATERTGRKDRGDSVEVASAGVGSGGGDSGAGSPVGLIVAVAIVAAGVSGGLWVRRHRRGPAAG